MFKKYKKYIWVIVAALAVSDAVWGFYPNRTVRYAVFAGYNGDGTIHPYVITYLKGLKEVSDGVVYVADSTLNPEEEKKLKDLTIHYENVRHEEYDWGSYKRGFNWLKDNGYLDKADEVIFANDSCYAPITGFKPMFETMDRRKDLDFWGALQNTRFTPHVQSYFMVLRKNVLQSRQFQHFINGVRHQPDSSLYITEYEVKLTPYLHDYGYKWDSFIPYQKLAYLPDSEKNSYPLALIKDYGYQFIKRRIFKNSLMMYENEAELLRYVYQLNPTLYQEIATEIPERFIPDDLKEKTNAH